MAGIQNLRNAMQASIQTCQNELSDPQKLTEYRRGVNEGFIEAFEVIMEILEEL